MDGARGGQRSGAERASSACCSLRATCAGCVIQCGSCFVRVRTCVEPQGQHAQSNDPRNKRGGRRGQRGGRARNGGGGATPPAGGAPARARARRAHAPARGAPAPFPRIRTRPQTANAASLNESTLATGKLLTHVQPAIHSLQTKPRSFMAVARYNWLRPCPPTTLPPLARLAIDTSFFN